MDRTPFGQPRENAASSKTNKHGHAFRSKLDASRSRLSGAMKDLFGPMIVVEHSHEY